MFLSTHNRSKLRPIGNFTNPQMDFAQKIYIDNKPLILSVNAQSYIDNHPAATDYLILKGATAENFRRALKQINKRDIHGAIIEGADPKALHRELYAIYTPIDAGGGVVTNEQDDVLMIYRRGKWDLPKGKHDEGETIEECAVREVSEETGLNDLKLGEKICDTFHVYKQNNENLLKRTAWYKMQGTINEKPVPQEEENILEVRWVKSKELPEILNKTYEAIREVIQIAGVKY